jgi:beta-mannosidase
MKEMPEMKALNLNENWKLLEAPLDWGREGLARVLAAKEGWMDCRLPCDVHTPLEAAGRIRDVVLADYSFDAEWIEKRSWWFVREFTAEAVDLSAEVVELTLESLDAHADVFLNGEWLGTHVSAHYPFVRGVKGRVREGANVLAVRLTTGLEQVSDRDLAEINWAVCTEASNGCPERGDKRRGCLRKPQYAVGWDWGPKALTCGIVKGAYLRSYNKTAIRGAHLTTVCAAEGGDALLSLALEIDQLHVYKTRDADVEVRLMLNGEPTATCSLRDALLTSGLNDVHLDIDVPGARLWWPAGYGEQPLYKVEIAVLCEGEREEYPPFFYGIRRIRLDTARTDEKRRRFQLIVNDVPVFCKGGDWIPADSVYARVTPEKYENLVREAKNANFNMLRIWGGGLYERDEFYDACDRHGILLWHDFMFGCATSPDHLEWFRREVEREMDHQTRRLRNRACLALWCGNNENHWIFNPEDNPSWGVEPTYEKQYGLMTSNALAKTALRNNCPEIPYWNSSPYGGALPNSDDVGDVHHWHACMMNPDMAKRIEPKEYDKVNARFVTEYGYPGPCPVESIRQYLDGRPIDRTSRVWDLHNNTFEKKTVAAGIEKHYLDGAADLDLDDYILYAGLTQSLMLGYSLEAMRFKDFCSGGLFWMYNDTWGEVGWTIIDYYLRRKISFYGVKRAFEPVKLTLRLVDGRVLLQGCNDTGEDLEIAAKLGYLRFDGTEAKLEPVSLTLPARSRRYLLDLALPEEDYERGAFVVLPERRAEPAVLRLKDTRALKLPGGSVQVVGTRREGEDLVVTLKSDRFLHGVHIKEPLNCSDNYFDLLPGQQKTVRIEGAGEANPAWHSVR